VAETRGDHAVKRELAVGGNAKFSKGVDSPYLEIIDQKVSGTSAGTFTGGTWRTRDLTNVVFDDFSFATNPGFYLGLGGDFTLNAGLYYCDISAPAFNVNEHVARLADVTDDPGDSAPTVVLGTSEFAADTELWRDFEDRVMLVASASQTRSFVTGRFQLSGTRTLEVQHRCSNTQTTDGFGSDGLFYGTNNVYTVVKMWLIRDDT
jgi:hypothetical protein